MPSSPASRAPASQSPVTAAYAPSSCSAPRSGQIVCRGWTLATGPRAVASAERGVEPDRWITAQRSSSRGASAVQTPSIARSGVGFRLFGSSASGKWTVLPALRGRVPRLEACDFDEVGVPPVVDRSWRHRANEAWLRRALELQAAGTDLLLGCQTPLGEMLAS